MPLTSPLLAAFMALTAATCWGAGDFTSGLAARRSDAFRSVLISYSIGLAALAAMALASGEKLPPAADLGWGALAGLSGMTGLGFLLQGFASGRMGIIAPVSAVLTAALPVIFHALTEGLPDELQLTGFALALAGIWLLSRPERSGDRLAGIGLAVAAGLGFGGFFIALDQIGENAVFWPLVAGRLVACSVLVLFALATRRPVRLGRPVLGLLALAGVLDAAGNLFFLLAVQNGRLDVTAVLSSLYPAVTAILAWLVIKEHLTTLQVIGVSAAILAIVLITL
jgi:drug/metabolite transporter (DMT)-like permease